MASPDSVIDQLDLLILRSLAKPSVSKEEARGLMVRDGADAPPHHEEQLTCE